MSRVLKARATYHVRRRRPSFQVKLPGQNASQQDLRTKARAPSMILSGVTISQGVRLPLSSPPMQAPPSQRLPWMGQPEQGAAPVFPLGADPALLIARLRTARLFRLGGANTPAIS